MEVLFISLDTDIQSGRCSLDTARIVAFSAQDLRWSKISRALVIPVRTLLSRPPGKFHNTGQRF